MSRATVWLLVCVVVVTAGCGALGADDGADEATRTLTPVSVRTPAPTPTPTTVAPGLAADRIVNSTALVATHGAVINDTSHTYRRQVARTYPNGTVWREYTTVIERNESALRYRHTWTTADGTERTVERWRTDGRTYVARTGENGTTVTVADRSDGGVVLGTSSGYVRSLPSLLDRLNVGVNGTASSDGQQYYRLETPKPKTLSPSRNVTFVGRVTPEGVFTDYRLTYRVERRDIRIDISVTASFEEVGSTTVTRPAWVDRAQSGSA